jgi:hypothetical protein
MSAPTYEQIIDATYPNKLVDLIDAEYFGAQAHKVKLLNERLDPNAWFYLKDLLGVMLEKHARELKEASDEMYENGYNDGMEKSE